MLRPAERVAVNGIEIAYETFGDRSDQPLILVMGLGTQMIAWPDDLCQGLADRGHFVVRFDNRDVGESTHLGRQFTPRLGQLLAKRSPVPYEIDDMADDALALMDALELAKAHLVGASLGGFIAQTVALRAPDRVASLTLVMTSTGSRRVGRTEPKLFMHMLRRRGASDRDAVVKRTIDTVKLIGSPGFEFDEEYWRDLAARSFDRGRNPAGYFRQMAAIAVQPDRTRALAKVAVPTLVLHGLDDRMVAVSGGLALAKAIPGSRFVGFAGMGHDLPRELWPKFVAEISELTSRAVRV